MLILEFLSQPIWQQLGLTLVHFLWQGLVVAVLIGAFVKAFRLNHGITRYAVYLLAFVVMIACPIVTFTTIDIPTSPDTEFAKEAESTQVVGSISYTALPAGDILPEADISSHVTPRPAATDSIPLSERISDWLHISMPWVLLIWMVGVVILSVRLLMGFIGVYRWRHHLESLPERLAQRIASLSEGLGMRGFSRVFISPSVLQAMAVGYLRPMVLLPAAMITQMQPEMLEAVIAHELAHIRRFDLWVNLAQRVTETLLFYHPAVWWLSDCLRNERELCCDELAIKATGERATYASALESVSRTRLITKQPILATGLGQDNKPTLSRVRHILGLATAHRNCPFWLAGLITVLFLVALTIPTALVLSARADEKHGLKTEGKDRCYFTGHFELEKDIPIKLELKPQGKRMLVSADSIRFDRDGSGIKTFLKAYVRRGLVFDWRTKLKLFGDRLQLIDIREREIVNKSSALVSGNPIYKEMNIEFQPLSVSDVKAMRRFEISLELIGSVKDSLRREIDNIVETELIRGRVTDWRGEPIVDAIVTVVEHKPGSKSKSTRIPSTTTNEQGYYEFGAVNWPYRLRVDHMQELPSGTEYYEMLNLKKILHGPTKADFQFNEPEKGDASLECRVTNGHGRPLTKFKVNVSLDVDWKQVDFEDPAGSYLKYYSYTKKVEDYEGSFRLNGIPSGDYKIWVIPEEKEYEWPRKKVTIVKGEAKEEIIQVTSKFVLYGRVLFDDGMPAVIKPSPWPGAKCSILLPMGGRARGIAELDGDGYFQVHLSTSEYENLETGKRELVISIPTLQEGRRKTAGNFPFGLLSEERDKAGVVRVKRP